MKEKRFIFVGNRRFVLERMLTEGVNLTDVIVIEETHLARDFSNGVVNCPAKLHSVSNKKDLLSRLSAIDFDVLVSNGCPYILPISSLPNAIYVNIHPSYLPELRGVDPVIGAILYSRDSGATCHLMDDGIDSGAIVSQVKIALSEDLDASTLYQLSFHAEQAVFSESLSKNFAPQYTQVNREGIVSYRRRPEDQVITFGESNDLILRKIKAFSNRSQGCVFYVNEHPCRVYSACRMNNKYLIDLVASVGQGKVALSYENSIVFGKDGEVLRFNGIVFGERQVLRIGDRLF